MTDDNLPVMRSRGTAVAPLAAEQRDQFSAALEVAHELSKAGPDVLPKAYRGNRGAVLLVTEWARHNDVAWLTAIQGVSFVQGRPVIDATLQRALAERAGYRVTVKAASPKSATVAVSKDGDVLGEALFTIEDAERAKLTGKDNWRTYAEDMLVARATSRAVRRYCAGVLVGMATPDEVDVLPRPEFQGAAPVAPAEVEASRAQEHPIVVPASEADRLVPASEAMEGQELLALEVDEVTPASVDEPPEMIHDQTKHKLQAALSQVDAAGLRNVLNTAAEDGGVDPGHLVPRRFKLMTEAQAWTVLDLASQLMSDA